MPNSQPNMHYWHFFLAIEADLAATARYVQISRDNYQTYSIEFARILLSGCSEVDVVSKLLCQQIDARRPVGNINEYREAITTRFPRFSTMEVLIPRYGLTLKPWDEWGNKQNPAWWNEHQGVKHFRDQHFPDANLKNALHSLAGLFCLELYLYGSGPMARRDELEPWPQLLAVPKGPPAHLICEDHYGLPDDPAPN